MDVTLNKTAPPTCSNTIDYVGKTPVVRREELQFWRQLLHKDDDRLIEELNQLNSTKEAVFAELENIQGPISVLEQCLKIKDSIPQVGDMEDEAERQTRKESVLMNTVKNDYDQKIFEIDDIADLLEECRENLHDHLKISDEELMSELQPQPKPTPGGPDHGPARADKWNTQHQACEEKCRFMHDRIHQEIVRAANLRLLANRLMKEHSHEVRVQRDACLLAFTMRVNDVQKEMQQLASSKKEKENEIDVLSRKLAGLEQALRARMPSRRMTQQQKGSILPGGLEDMQEGASAFSASNMMSVQADKKLIQHQMQNAREGIGNLQHEISVINCETTLKGNQLSIGTQCLQLRDTLTHKPIIRSPADWITGPLFRAKPNLPPIVKYSY